MRLGDVPPAVLPRLEAGAHRGGARRLGPAPRHRAVVRHPQAAQRRHDLPDPGQVLRLSGVSKRFGRRTVLNAVSLDVAAGEYVAVIGDSGIGKSTLLNVIAGLEPADAGEIVFEEMHLGAMTDDALALLRRDKFGFVFQAFHVLPHLSVEENVALPLLLRGITARERVRQMLAAVGLASS